ncbi:MAG: hypothetical protein R3B96_06670 [Pirellulaceae bacterium]
MLAIVAMPTGAWAQSPAELEELERELQEQSLGEAQEAEEGEATTDAGEAAGRRGDSASGLERTLHLAASRSNGFRWSHRRHRRRSANGFDHLRRIRLGRTLEISQSRHDLGVRVSE